MWKLGGTKLLMVLSGSVIVALMGGVPDGRPIAYIGYGACAFVAGYVALSILSGIERKRSEPSTPSDH